MQKFTAMVVFPTSFLCDMTKKLEGIATINQLTLSGDEYNGDVTFELQYVHDFFTATNECDGRVENLTPVESSTKKVKTSALKSYAASRKVGKNKKKHKFAVVVGTRNENARKITNKLHKYLEGGWRSVDEMLNTTGVTKSVIWNRLMKFRQNNELESRIMAGSNNLKEYRIV